MNPGDLTGIGRDALIRMLEIQFRKAHEYHERIKELEARVAELEADVTALTESFFADGGQA